LLVIIIGLGTSGVASAASPSPEDTVATFRVDFPVTLSDGNRYTVAGFAYVQTRTYSRDCAQKREVIQVLVHGATYDHRYWDAEPIGGSPYSYARSMAARCYSVLAIDRLGAGASSRPDGDLLGLANDASSVAQVLQSLRQVGNPMGHAFPRIVLVGHSFGTFSTTYTLGTYGNLADAFVATGWTNSPGVVPVDPAYIESLFATPYITLPPEVRTALFYAPQDADPAVIAYDNSVLAGTFTRGFLADAVGVFTARALGNIGQIKALTRVDRVGVPVFVQLADADALFPASLGPAEAPLYSASPSVTVDTLAATGHSFNLHRSRGTSWDRIDGWIATTLLR
jgi:pimeloyl-ACP methyl ester carboxylesterase